MIPTHGPPETGGSDFVETLEEYQQRMMNCDQFREQNISPLWRLGEGDVEGFCYDEVVRQYHDPRIREDGGCRVNWMRAGWAYAEHASSNLYGLPSVQDIINLGSIVEPNTNAFGLRLGNVHIGARTGAPPARLFDMLSALVSVAPSVDERGMGDPALLRDFTTDDFEDQVSDWVETADDWYLAYEWVHPFMDGNGRSGKILNNWLRDTLGEPYLVPDYFGGGNP